MRHLPGLLRRVRADSRGATIVEFAIVSVPFLMLMLGLVDMGYRQYMRVMLSGSLQEASRQVTVGGITTDTVNSFVTARMRAISSTVTVNITPTSYYDYSGIAKMEPITSDKNNNGLLDSGDCYADYNGDKVRDTNNGNTNLGESEDVIYYTATATYPSFVPVGLLGMGPTESVTTTTMMRNQPYGAQPDPTVCV